jgi:hypothetical protein
MGVPPMSKSTAIRECGDRIQMPMNILLHDPFLVLAIGFLLLLGSAVCGIAAIASRFVRSAHASVRPFALASIIMAATVLPAYQLAAPGTNFPERAYRIEAVLSGPAVIAVFVSTFSGKSKRQGFEVIADPAKDKPGEGPADETRV